MKKLIIAIVALADLLGATNLVAQVNFLNTSTVDTLYNITFQMRDTQVGTFDIIIDDNEITYHEKFPFDGSTFEHTWRETIKMYSKDYTKFITEYCQIEIQFDETGRIVGIIIHQPIGDTILYHNPINQ